MDNAGAAPVAPYVPYQAYKSKRHGRNSSFEPQPQATNLNGQANCVVNQSDQTKRPTPGHGASLSASNVVFTNGSTINGATINGDANTHRTFTSASASVNGGTAPGVPAQARGERNTGEAEVNGFDANFNVVRLKQRPVSMMGALPVHVPLIREPSPEGSPSVDGGEGGEGAGAGMQRPSVVIPAGGDGANGGGVRRASVTSLGEGMGMGTVTESPSSLTPTPTSVASPSPIAGPSSSSKPPPSTQRKVSTFRHVPLRPSPSSPTTTSTLRPAASHGRSLSVASALTPNARPRTISSSSSTSTSFSNTSTLRGAVPSTSSPLARPVSVAEPPSPIAQDSNITNGQGSRSVSPRVNGGSLPITTTTTATTAAGQPEIRAPPPRTSSLQHQHQHQQQPPSRGPPSPTYTPAPTSSGAPTLSQTPSTSSSTATTTRSSTPTQSTGPGPIQRTTYRPGFQPKGVYRPLTDQFLALRNAKREEGRVERTRLERRLDKLIDLHFSDSGGSDAGEKGNSGVKGKEREALKQSRRASSFFDIDFSELRSKSASEIWKGVLESGKGRASDVRAAEQAITHWQDDSEVSACPLCNASFHPLTNRKHHCRLCGRIVCSLPPKHPQRPTVCSLLFVADPKTGAIEEVGEVVDYGVRRPSTPSVAGKGEEEKTKGVRICRDCRPVMLHQQYRADARRVPTYARLYAALTALESEISDALPQFQELLLSLSNHPDDAPSKEASAARKKLLGAFADYDGLAKRIRGLPCVKGGAQDRVQAAIYARANGFLQRNMFPLQSLPKPKSRSSETSPPSSSNPNSPGTGDTPVIDPSSSLAHALQPLLEQEALLESFIDEATSRRKFEDAKTLKANLAEIRGEIERIVANAEDGAIGGVGGGAGKKGMVRR